MEEITRTIVTFIWFLRQTVTVGGLGSIWFLAPCIALLAIMIWNLPKSTQDRHRLLRLGVLPFIWIFVGLWGAYFWMEWQNPAASNPGWATWPVYAALPLVVVLSAFFLFFLKGNRAFVAAFVIFNVYFTLAMSGLAGMAITGDWL